MPETLFAFDEQNYRTCQTRYRGERDQEYYLGDYTIEDGEVIEVRAERKAVGAVSIIRLRSRTRLIFRRSWAHIRADATDVTVLWFVKRGRLSVSTQNGSVTASVGDFVVTRSMTPFLIECEPDDAQMHEVLHVTIPTHGAREFMSDDVTTGFSVSADRKDFALVETILVNLLEDESDFAPDTCELLVSSALSVVGHAVRDQKTRHRSRQSITERRLADVRRYIEMHLSDPNLNAASVAQGCGISPRYLSFLLRQNGTSFSAVVWGRRLAQARNWLASSESNAVSISEIAYNIGFKSPAHFSRMFKREFGANPSEYRLSTHLAEGEGARSPPAREHHA